MTWSRSLRVPMHAGRRIVTLAEVLAPVPENAWDWRLWDLDGIGHAPGGVPMADFEREVREAPGGFPFDWPALLRFAAGMAQVHDCLLTAASPGVRPTAEEVLAEDYRRLLLVVAAEDSSGWLLTSRLARNADDPHRAWRSLAAAAAKSV